MTSLAGARVAVTGGAGFIGSHLVDELAGRRRAARVTVIDSLAGGSRAHLAQWAGDDRVGLVAADIRSDTALKALAGVDVVFHLAATGVRRGGEDPRESHEVNATGTLALLDRARAAGVRRFVHVSGGEVFGGARRARIDERHPAWPDSAFGASKLAGEAYARAAHREHDLPVTVVRPFSTYGPRGHFGGDAGGILPRAIVRNLCGLPAEIPGDGGQTRDLMHVSDTARGLAAIAQCDAAVGRTINLGTGVEVTLDALARVVAWLIGRPDLEPVHLVTPRRDARRVLVDAHLMHRLTGFTPAMPLDVGVGDLIRWFRSRPRSPEQILALLDRQDPAEAGRVAS